MKLSLEQLQVTSFATTAVSVVQLPASSGGEDCFSRPRFCPPLPGTGSA